MKYREHLPQLDGGTFLTDGGIETTLIFHQGLELPEFAAFDLLKDDRGTEQLRDYYEPYLRLAGEHGVGFVAESPTWRANPRWGLEIGYDEGQLDAMNRKAIALMEELREEHESEESPVVISGCIGPQDDGYNPSMKMGAEQAQEYHATQIATFADTAADMVTALTLTYTDEATGIVRAARQAGLPVAISFTLETDGRLPSGDDLGEAIDEVDSATGGGPDYFMLNCAHPTHFRDTLDPGGDWLRRIRGLRANASTKSHAELDEATELDAGNPAELGEQYADLRERLPGLAVLGGCCGTDDRHLTEITHACLITRSA